MKEVILFSSGGKHLKDSIKKNIKNKKCEFVDIEKQVFPDGEMGVRIPKNIKGKNITIVQSFYHDPNNKIIETLFATNAAKQSKAKKVNLFASYFPYLRKDKSFEKGECVSAEAVTRIFD